MESHRHTSAGGCWDLRSPEQVVAQPAVARNTGIEVFLAGLGDRASWEDNPKDRPMSKDEMTLDQIGTVTVTSDGIRVEDKEAAKS